MNRSESDPSSSLSGSVPPSSAPLPAVEPDLGHVAAVSASRFATATAPKHFALPSESGWDDARRAWNLAADQRPVAVAEPESAEEVMAVVELARTRGLRVAAHSTGHAAAALGDLEQAILVRTHRMRDVQVDAKARRARVHAGARWADVVAPAAAGGLETMNSSSLVMGAAGLKITHSSIGTERHMTGTTIDGVQHHRAEVNDTDLHYVTAGDDGSPVLLVHGFPETWWVFHRLMPLLAEHHRVFAVDLRGFGDSAIAGADHDSATAAADLASLIDHLGVGPVHLTGQDISGATTFRLAATRPELVRSWTAIEVGLPGFGFEQFADVAHGGAWHIGVLAAPGIAEMLLSGRERAFIADYAIPSLTATPDAFTDADVDALVRAYARKGGFTGAAGLYRSALAEGAELRALAGSKLAMPVLAVGGASGEFTAATVRQVADEVTPVVLDGVGHYVAMEAHDRLADTLAGFYRELDGGGVRAPRS